MMETVTLVQESSTPIPKAASDFQGMQVIIAKSKTGEESLPSQGCSTPFLKYTSTTQPMAAIQSPKTTIQEIRVVVDKLSTEKGQLQEELYYARSACAELHSQNQHLQKLLCEAQAALPPKEGPRHSHPTNQAFSSTTWVGGTWLSPSPQIPSLVPVQKAWLTGKTQQALALLTEIIVQKNIDPNDRIEAGLLFSTIMRSSGELARAVTHAEICLKIANEQQSHEMIGKAQFHLGLSYFYQDKYADARWCFVLASHTKGHHELIEINMQMVEERLLKLPSGHPGTKLGLKC